MKEKFTKIIALSLAMTMALSACSNNSNSSITSSTSGTTSNTTNKTMETAKEPTEVKENKIDDLVLGKLASSELETFNILSTHALSDFEILEPCWSVGLYHDREGKLVADLASEWGTEDGGLTWTMKIRDDLKWANVNGEAVADLTAQDWATSLEWVLNHHKNLSKNTSMPSEMIRGAAEYYEYTASLSEEEAYALNAEPGSKFMEMVGIEIPDATTVVYHCVAEKPYFDSLLKYGGMAPLSQGLIDELGVKGVMGMDNTTMWYCGPYLMTEFIHGNAKTYEPNPLYWNQDVERFDSVTHKMIDTWDVGYLLYQNGEIDYCSLTEAQLKTISENPDHEYYNQLAADWPKAQSFQFHLNFNKMNEDGSVDTNWNLAAANENFRQAWYYGLDLTDFWKRANTLNPLTCENVCYTGRNLVWTSDGKDYTTTLSEKIGLVKNGETPVRYQPEKAAEYKAKAVEELTAAGVTFPIEVDYYIVGSNQTELDTATVLKDMFSACLGDDFVTLNICTYISSVIKEVRTPQLHSFVINGWGADYDDPQNYMAQLVYGSADANYSEYWNNLNEVEANENTQNLIDTYTEFTKMVEEADKITTDMDARYNAYMDAEAYALNHALVIPCYYKEGYCLTRYNVFAPNATNKYIDWETNKDGYSSEEIAASKAAMLG